MLHVVAPCSSLMMLVRFNRRQITFMAGSSVYEWIGIIRRVLMIRRVLVVWISTAVIMRTKVFMDCSRVIGHGTAFVSGAIVLRIRHVSALLLHDRMLTKPSVHRVAYPLVVGVMITTIIILVHAGISMEPGALSIRNKMMAWVLIKRFPHVVRMPRFSRAEFQRLYRSRDVFVGIGVKTALLLRRRAFASRWKTIP